VLAKRIIPCLDVKDGRVVKGVNFLNLRDAGDPVEAAQIYDQQGADELVFLDITASHEKRKIIIDVVHRTAQRIFMPLTVGGGINSTDEIRELLRAGADKVSINTAAVRRPDFVWEAAEMFGSQCMVVAIDAKRRPDQQDRWEVFTHGGRTPTGLDAITWAQQVEPGLPKSRQRHEGAAGDQRSDLRRQAVEGTFGFLSGPAGKRRRKR